MQITNVSIPAPDCQHHITLNYTVQGQARTVSLTRSDLTIEHNEVTEAVVYRLRSFQRENGYTFAQLRANLAGKTFHI